MWCRRWSTPIRNWWPRCATLAGGGVAHAPMIFDTLIEPETGELLSEDYAFLPPAGAIWAARSMPTSISRFTHSGHTTYSGSLIDARGPLTSP